MWSINDGKKEFVSLINRKIDFWEDDYLVVTEHLKSPNNTDLLFLKDTTVLKGNDLYSHPGSLNQDENLAVKLVRDVTKEKEWQINQNVDIVDPRLIGLLPTSMIEYSAFLGKRDAFVGAEKRINTNVSNGKLKGIDVKIVSYTRPSGGLVEFWIAPSKGFQMLRCRLTSSRTIDSHDEFFVDQVDFELKLYNTIKGKPFWFPSLAKYTRTLNENLVLEENTKIVEFETPLVSDSVIDISSMGIPAGTNVIVFPSIPLSQKWGGKNIVPITQNIPSDELKPRKKIHSTFWLFVSLNLAIVSLIFVVFIFFKDRKQSKNK